MPIQYVGGNTGTWVGSTGTTNTISLTALTGGIATSAAIGDLVIAVYSTGATVDRTLSITTGYTLIATELYSNGTSYDTNLRVAYKVLTAADTTVSFGPTGNAADAGAAAVYVFRGVSGVIFDVTTTTATGTGTGRPTPPAITPVDPGTVIVAIGAGAAQTGAVYTTATLTAFRSVTSSDTYDAMLGIGHFFWTSGTYTPAQFTGGTTNAADSWAAMTIALQATQTFNVTRTESVTATATQDATAIVTINETRTESVTATDSSDAFKSGQNATITETVTATDSSVNVETSNAWLTENTVSTNGGFVNTVGFGGFSAVSSTTTSNTVSGIRFIANQTRVAGIVTVGIKRVSTGPTQPVRITLWQLASNSLTANPSTNLGELTIAFSSLPTGDVYTLFDFSSLNITLTQGTGYAITVSAPSDLTGSGATFQISTVPTALGDKYNYYRSIYSNISGTYPSTFSNTTTAFTIDLQPVQATAAIQNGIYNPSVNITETASATDNQTGVYAQNVAITESVITSESSQPGFAKYSIFQDGSAFISYLGASTGSSVSLYAGTTTVATGTFFTAANTGFLGGIRVLLTRTNTALPLPTQPFTLELWSATGTTLGSLIASQSYPLTTSYATTSGNTVQVSVPNPAGFFIAVNTSYAIILRAGSDWISGSTQNISIGRNATGNPASWPVNSQPSSSFTINSTGTVTIESASTLSDRARIIAVYLGGFDSANYSFVNASITESVTATDSFTAGQSGKWIAESVTATDSSSATKITGVYDVDQTTGVMWNWSLALGNTNSASTTANFRAASFLAAESGVLGLVALAAYISAGPTPASGITFKVYQISSYTSPLNTGTLLGTVTVPVSNIGNTSGSRVIADFSDLNITLTAGNYYATSYEFDWNSTATTLTYFYRNGVNAGSTWAGLFTDSYYGFFTNNSTAGTYKAVTNQTLLIVKSTTNTNNTQTGGFTAGGTITESVTATTSENGTFSLGGNITESVTATDAETASLPSNVSITESVTATDAETASLSTNVSITESVTATDAETASLSTNVSITESVTATDTQSAIATINVANVETVTATDTQSVIATINVSNVETVTATDAQTAIFTTSVSITESVTATDSEDVVITFTSDITEAVSATDSEDATLSTNTSITETVTATATEVVLASTFNASITESVTATDTYIGVGGEVYDGGAFAFGPLASAAIADANTNYSAIATQGVVVYLTSVVGTGATGTVVVQTNADVNVTDVTGTGVVGQVAIAVQDIITGGAFAFGAIAASTFADARADYDQITTQGVEVYLTSVTGTGEVGTVTPSANSDVSVTGVFATGVVPQRDTTNGGTFALGPIASAPIADAYEPIPEVIGTAGIDVTGVVGTGETGTLTMTGAGNVYPIGVSGAGQIGDEATSADANVYVSGVQATGQTGTVNVTCAANVYVDGVVGTLVLGTVTVAANSDVSVTGVVGTGETGTLTMTGDANVNLVGVQAVGQIGYVIIQSGYVVTGVQATGYVGTVMVWSDIPDNQNPNWQAVNDSQAGSWTDVDDSQAGGWTDVDDSQTDNWTEVDDGNTVVWTKIVI